MSTRRAERVLAARGTPDSACAAHRPAPGCRGPRLAAASLCALLLASAAGAQSHTDAVRGFKFKPPKDYVAVALSPGESITVAKYQDKATDYGGDQGTQSYNRVFAVSLWPYDTSDDQEGAEDTKSGPAATPAPATPASRKAKADKQKDSDEDGLDGFIKQIVDLRFGFCEIDKEKDISIAGSSGREMTLTSTKNPLKIYLVILEQEDGRFVFEGSAIAERFDKAVLDFSKAAKSFTRMAKKDTSSRDAELSQMSEQDRFLQQQIDKLPPGWDHLRSKRYLFLFDADKDFVKQMAEQIEALRNEYERLYPPDKPIEAVSIVRVCKNRDEYLGYGGSEGSGGYWNSAERELVIFDQRPRDVTFATLNHEAFHQYIYYFYGELSPHSWYNEGTGDYFAGAKMTKTFRVTGYAGQPGGIERPSWIKEGARLMRQGKTIAEGAAVPLKQIMHFSQQEYYGGAGATGLLCYAEGWAIVHMLRESKSLQPKWEQILPDYLTNLLAAREEVAEELMKKRLADAEKVKKGSSEELPKDPKEYFDDVDETAVQNRAYDKTFKDWTDEDWDKFQDFFLNYVEKL